MKGRLSLESKNINSKVGYGLSLITDLTNIGNMMLLLQTPAEDIEICEETNQVFKLNPELRNLVQLFNNKTL